MIQKDDAAKHEKAILDIHEVAMRIKDIPTPSSDMLKDVLYGGLSISPTRCELIEALREAIEEADCWFDSDDDSYQLNPKLDKYRWMIK